MSKPYKRADPLAPKHSPSDAGRAEKDAARLGRDTRGWVAANKHPGKEFEARRNLPSGSRRLRPQNEYLAILLGCREHDPSSKG